MPGLAEDMAEAIAASRKDVAELLRDKMTRLAAVDVPGLVRHRVYEATQLTPYKPVVQYIGYAIGLTPVVLSENPEGFLSMVKAGGAKIESPAQAAEYAAGFLHCTRPLTRLAYVVRSAADVRFQPNLSGAKLKAKESFEDEYAKVIKPPRAEERDGRFRATVFMVVEQELRRFDLVVAGDGAIEPDVEVLEEGLPLVGGGL